MLPESVQGAPSVQEAPEPAAPPVPVALEPAAPPVPVALEPAAPPVPVALEPPAPPVPFAPAAPPVPVALEPPAPPVPFIPAEPPVPDLPAMPPPFPPVSPPPPPPPQPHKVSVAINIVAKGADRRGVERAREKSDERIMQGSWRGVEDRQGVSVNASGNVRSPMHESHECEVFLRPYPTGTEQRCLRYGRSS